MLGYDELKDKEREFLSVTSVTVFEFQILLVAFEEAFAETAHLTAKGQPRKRKKGGGSRGKLPRAEDKLLFILSYLKNYPLQTYHGQQFGLSQSKTNERLHDYLPKLRRACQLLCCAPSREATEWAARLGAQAERGVLAQDGVERMRERPQDKERQKEYYSGKKNAQREESRHRAGGEALA
jgi:Helix-turn-helix of DDE superfamily endonuclease